MKVEIYNKIKDCPGKFHGWFNSSVGIIRKPNASVSKFEEPQKEAKAEVEPIIKKTIMAMQIKYSFDKETIIKIIKGMLIAATGAGALYLLDFLGKLKIDNIAMASFVAWFVPVAVNIVREWLKGVARQPER
jgi:hypothetical protein